MTHKLYRTQEEIENWLNQYEIKKYELIEDKEYGYVVNVYGDVVLFGKKLKEVKIKFNAINGNFDCSNNKLKTLKGCPKVIKGNFLCNRNQLTSLKYCPSKVYDSLICSYNKLINLEFSPNMINGNFLCSYNKLKSLEGCPKIIKGKVSASNNQLNTLEYFFEKVNGSCDLYNNEKLKEIQYIENFEELKKIHDSIALKKKLNNKLEKEIIIDNIRKNVKIKL